MAKQTITKKTYSRRARPTANKATRRSAMARNTHRKVTRRKK